jgi:hypothetical protein
MATKPTTPFTVALSEDEKFWQVFEDGNVRTSFNSKEQAEHWCTINELEYTVV